MEVDKTNGASCLFTLHLSQTGVSRLFFDILIFNYIYYSPPIINALRYKTNASFLYFFYILASIDNQDLDAIDGHSSDNDFSFFITNLNSIQPSVRIVVRYSNLHNDVLADMPSSSNYRTGIPGPSARVDDW